MTFLFSTTALSSLQIMPVLLLQSESKVSPERVIRSVHCLTIIIYKGTLSIYLITCLLVMAFRIYLTDFHTVYCGVAVGDTIMRDEYIGIIHLWWHALTMMTWELSSSLAKKHLFFFLKEYLTLCGTWFFTF